MLTSKVPFWGDHKIVHGTPPVVVIEDVIFVQKQINVPYEQDASWGIYDADGHRLITADLRRGAAAQRVGGADQIDIDITSLPYIDETLVYGGALNLHFGHFVCSSLSRLWYIKLNLDSRVIFHTDHDYNQLMEIDFVAKCLSLSGISEGQTLRLEGVSRIRRLIVPGSAFEEQFQAFSNYRDYCIEIGEHFRQPKKSGPPIYLSKTKLKHGVSRIGNEDIIENIMINRGVQIIRPETLSFSDQIKLFWEDRPILGSVGSAFHTHIFAEGTAPLIAFQAFGDVNSNFALIDKLANRRVTYLAPTQKSVEDQSDPRFLLVATVVDPVGVAGGMLARI